MYVRVCERYRRASEARVCVCNGTRLGFNVDLPFVASDGGYGDFLGNGARS